jgi:serine protease Do
VLRGAREKTLAVTLVERSDAIREDAQLDAEGAPPEEAWLGLDVAEIASVTRVELGLPDDLAGVIVLRVHGGSPGAKAAVRPGTLIKEIGDSPVRTLEEFREAIARVPAGRPVVLLLEKDGVTRYTSVEK